jgi:hypothetical protein
MSAARSRRFPPVSGPYGWAGAALFLAAIICELVAILGLTWAAFNNAFGQAVPWLITFLVSLPLFAAATWLWRQGWKRAGVLPPSSSANQQRPALLRAGAMIILGSVLGFGGFLYLAFALHGSRRLVFAFAALLAGTAILEVGTTKMYRALGRPVPSHFLGSSKRSSVIFVAVLLLETGLLLIGLLRPDLIPMP